MDKEYVSIDRDELKRLQSEVDAKDARIAELEFALRESAEYLDSNSLNQIGSGSQLHRLMIEAIARQQSEHPFAKRLREAGPQIAAELDRMMGNAEACPACTEPATHSEEALDMVQAALSPENQRIVPVEPFLAQEHPMAATPSEDGREVPLCTTCKGYGYYQDGDSGTESDGYAPNIEKCDCDDSERLPQYRSAPTVQQPDAQPARQVGGDEREAFLEWATNNWTGSTESAWKVWAARAALTPAAACVMPEPIYLRQPYEDRPWFWITPLNDDEKSFCTAFLRADEVARLNRNPIPVELLERISKSGVWVGCPGKDCKLVAELRALLGKEGGV